MNRPNEFGVGVGILMKITIAPWIWAFHFVICYGSAAIWCEKLAADGDVAPLYLFLLLVTGIALAGIIASGWIGWRSWTEGGYGEDGAQPGIDDVESRDRFLGHVSVLLAVVSAIGVVYVLLPILLIGSCR
ncbi:hypothetical protein PARPLA_02767 [Rhodobacteraceae bacterium THAF1]|uniref:hypothetical protein n=1 Tax=Palleronia sp. THAF1 TaxID=2587842 RepID=UPI000F3D8DD5|nr:hypothetical protein [Palleronia sp. THAF1]QFU08172.1 hypothetical protein FIU81_05745 [Palleronia sp. THAF1]VDC28723.1 hypothetical protein PARPLA_02767 [Rhodobacteraceae bacterium THAF1]